MNADGSERIYTLVAVLVDTNILVYRFDVHTPAKQKIAQDLLRQGMLDKSIRIPHQAFLEFVAAMTKPVKGIVLYNQHEAFREVEELMNEFEVLYPNDALLRLAMRGCAAYQLNWFDAHVWAYAEYYGLSELLTEDLQHDRLYGSVRVV